MDDQKKSKTKAELEKENEMLYQDAKAALELAGEYKRLMVKYKSLYEEGKELLLKADKLIMTLHGVNKLLYKDNARLTAELKEKEEQGGSESGQDMFIRMILGL